MTIPIKEKLLALYTKKLAKNDKVGRFNVGFQQANRIGLLYTQEDAQQKEHVLQFIDQLKSTGKLIYVLQYRPTQASPRDEEFPEFTKQAISYWGKILTQQVTTFLNLPLDYLYHIDLISNPILDYILAKSKAKCRMGNFDLTRAHLFEIMVKCENKIDSHTLASLTKKMLYYTQLLRI